MYETILFGFYRSIARRTFNRLNSLSFGPRLRTADMVEVRSSVRNGNEYLIAPYDDERGLTTATLDSIETASLAELRALQLERMRWSLAHAYAGNPRYREKFDAAGVHPDQLGVTGGSRTLPVHNQSRSG